MRDYAGRVQFDGNANVTVSHQILGPSEKRRSIIFIGPNAGRVTLSNDSPVVLDNGLTISSTSGMLELRYDIHGDLVQKPWHAIASAGGSIVSWIEVVALN